MNKNGLTGIDSIESRFFANSFFIVFNYFYRSNWNDVIEYRINMYDILLYYFISIRKNTSQFLLTSLISAYSIGKVQMNKRNFN